MYRVAAMAALPTAVISLILGFTLIRADTRAPDIREVSASSPQIIVPGKHLVTGQNFDRSLYVTPKPVTSEAFCAEVSSEGRREPIPRAAADSAAPEQRTLDGQTYWHYGTVLSPYRLACGAGTTGILLTDDAGSHQLLWYGIFFIGAAAFFVLMSFLMFRSTSARRPTFPGGIP
jgi:hypothetical protein